MTNLTIGQRIDVVNILPESDYITIKRKTYIAEVRESGYCSFFYAINSYGTQFESLNAEPFEFKKVGTFIVKSLKGGSNA